MIVYMSKKIKSCMIIMLLLMEVVTITLAQMSYKNKETKLEEVKLKENKVNKKSFAIMVEKKDKTGYEEYNENTWPTKGYEYNSTLSGCVDTTGVTIPNSLTYDKETNKVIVKTNVSSSCYLYFDLDKVLPETFTFFSNTFRFSALTSGSKNCTM